MNPSTVNWPQWTVILLKPDCLARGLTGQVLAWVRREVHIVDARTVRPTEEQVFAHYDDMLPLSAQLGRDVPAELRRIFVDKPTGVALGCGPNAASRLRTLIGPTDPAAAPAATIRGHFAADSLPRAVTEGRLVDNLIHSSDTAEVVQRDFGIWYGPTATHLLCRAHQPRGRNTVTAPAEPTISAGPRLLPVMPADQQAHLDPYMAQLVGYRKSGLSLNHIIGCPLDCGYCVRHFWGNWPVKTPHLLCSTEDAIKRLVGHEAFQPHVTPIQLFNKATDPFLPGVKPHLFQVLHALDERGYTNHVLVITRFTVTAADMAELERLRHLKVTLLFTYSGITDPRVEPIAKSAITVTSIRTAATHKRRTGVVLYWRPIVAGWNDSAQTMAHVLDAGRDVDAIVYTGYYHKPENAEYLRGLGVEVPYGEDFNRRKTMPADLDARVVNAWRASGIATPLFRKTSCAVAYAHQVADYNGHWGVRELCDICPTAQQQRCADSHRQPTPADMDRVLTHLGLNTPYLIENGHVWTHGLGEQRRYAIQHTLRYQIWELDQPHYLHAHGRSLHGHTPNPEQADAFAAVREQFTHATRYEDD